MKLETCLPASHRFLTRLARRERGLNQGFPRLLYEQSKLGASRNSNASESAHGFGFLIPKVRRLDLTIPNTKHILGWPKVAANTRLFTKGGEF